MAILDAVGRVFRWAAGAVVPMVVRPVAPVGLAWFVHVVLVAAAAVGLYVAQPRLGVREWVTRGPHQLHDYWLSLFFLLLYALSWAAAWLWALLTPGRPATDFPDIDDAWDEIRAALAENGIGLADTPLFLVLGEFPPGFEALFRALPNGLVVAGGSAPGSPIRAFANRDGIYLTVAGASLLGIQAWLLENGGDEEGEGDGSVMGRSVGLGASIGASVGADQSVGVSIGGQSVGSVGVGRPLNEIQQIIRRARDENRPLTDAERNRIRELSSPAQAAAAGPGRPAAAAVLPGGSVLQNPRLVADATARLSHVCELVAGARWPLCPVNGAILAVPAAVSDRDDAAQQWGLVAREDLVRAERALRLRFPVFALVGGMEWLPGGAGFFEKFAADRGGQRLGKGFPLNPDVRPAGAAEEVERATAWAFNGLLPYHLFKQMKTEGVAADVRENASLFRFLVELRRRGPRLARLVGRAVTTSDDRVPQFGGCYTAVTLPSAPQDVKFAREFFRKVESAQGAVAWTDDAYAADASYRSATRLGYVVLAAVLLAVTALGAYTAQTHFGKV